MTMTSHSQRPFRRPVRRGFTLLEMMIAVSLMALIFLGGMNLLLASSRTTMRTQSQMYATGDAANSIQNIISQIREAQSFTLPTSTVANQGEEGWVTPSNTTLSQFSTTLNGQAVNSACEITSAPALTPAQNNYKPSVTTIQVQLATGSKTITPYNKQTAGSVITLLYRGDPDGTPDPDPTGSAKKDAGTYLWQYVLPSDNSFSVTAHPPTLLCKSVSTSPNAVQFVRPTYAGVPEPNQMEIKVISGYYSPINGTQTSEEGNGASSSQLVGKCVYMRDHMPSAKTPASAAHTSNNAFQYH